MSIAPATTQRLRLSTEPVDRRQAGIEALPASPRDPVSPELALVDPELGRRERATLFEPGTFQPAPVAVSGWTLHWYPPARREPGPAAPASASIAVSGRQSIAGGAPTRIPSTRRAQIGGRGIVAVTAVALSIAAWQLWAPEEHPPGPAQATASAVTGRAETAPKRAAAAPASAVLQVVPAGEIKTLAWAPVKGATGYEVQLFRRSERVLLKRTRETHLLLRATWKYEGRIVKRKNGIYRWYVWPLLPGNRRGATAIVQARLEISARA
jgi:hypothetical protein